MDRDAHGSFAFDFKPGYTLIAVSGSWNLECASIYDALLRSRIENNPEPRRCVIIDGRRWGFETPEASDKLLLLNSRLARHYEELCIGYFLVPENFHLSRLILDTTNEKFKSILDWQFFTDLNACITWLNQKGFDIPKLSEDDFPEPIPAAKYLSFLE